MAKKDKVGELRAKSKFAAMEGLRPKNAFPLPPRKAMSQAKKASKGLAYPLPPYPNAGLPSLYRWASAEWRSLGRWQSLALPVIAIVALRTWEQERMLQDEYDAQLLKEETRRAAIDLYVAREQPQQRKKFFGII
jgi:hypothetical protein